MPGNLGEQVRTLQAIVPQAAPDGTCYGTAADRTDFHYAVLAVDTGASAGAPTAVSITAKVQDSTDGTTWADVAGATASALGANAHGEINLDLRLARKYVRAAVTVLHTGGTTPTTQVSAVWVLGEATRNPV